MVTFEEQEADGRRQEAGGRSRREHFPFLILSFFGARQVDL
jgi:hypothetical protein